MVLITLIASMAVVLIMVNKKIDMGISLATGGFILSILNGRDILHILSVMLEGILASSTLTLALTVALISYLGYAMDKFHILSRMIDYLEIVLRSAKLTILLAPTLIGTLLVTGGALMSCPVVDKLGDKLNISNDKRAAINLIFRHALYFVFPLSPTIILAAELGGFKLGDFIKTMFPMSIILYILGYLFFVRGCKEVERKKITKKEYIESIVKFLVFSSPILISLVGVLICGLPFYIALLIGIADCFIIRIYENKKNNLKLVDFNPIKMIKAGIKPKMVTAIFGIMIFKNIVNDIHEITDQLYAFLENGIPVELIIIIACVMIAFSLASVQSGVAVIFPMILPLAPDYDTKLLYAMFIYANAFFAYYISPLHLCQVLTLEYFGVNIKQLFKNYKLILPAAYAAMLVLYFIA